MTTNAALTDTIRLLQVKHDDTELHWYITAIIIPDLSQVIETLQICKNLLLYNSPQAPSPKDCIEKGPLLKLPISLHNKTDSLNGIVIRDGPYITDLSLTIKNQYFNKYVHKLQLGTPVILEQIVNCLNSINDSINLLQDLQSIDREFKEGVHNHNKLIETFEVLLHHIHDAKISLQIPTDPNLVFPLKVTNGKDFEPELSDHITVDFYTCDNQISLDAKCLHKITEKPWSEIDSTGKSFVDKLRDDMKLPSNTPSVHTIRTPSLRSSPVPSVNKPEQQPPQEQPSPRVHPLTVSEIEKKVQEKTPNNTNFLSNIMNHLLLRDKPKAMDYISRAITYNGMVVMVNKKFEVSTDDPILISISSKLNYIEKKINKFNTNINSLL
ncbi:Regulator of V-ATPase in vacuolar membrane protein 2 [Candida viswanathii]|uniref:Regulator of V-ATPase in vacuolar membrane protein 2 n=1 Tax=Candida viswanathii TaxID=5486 RepID=A0A367YPS3_9ASCO|nr:Regulator of V-ATPase in vacuolar membrane protein 2 [Candida viswanathii]